MKKYDQFINGRFVNSSSSKVIEVINPANEEVIAQVADGTVEDTQKAIDSSYEAQKEWARLASIERAGYLKKIASELEKEKESLARVIAEEQGKILSLARVEVSATSGYFDYMAGAIKG